MSATEVRRTARLYESIACNARGLDKGRFGDMADRFEAKAQALKEMSAV